MVKLKIKVEAMFIAVEMIYAIIFKGEIVEVQEFVFALVDDDDNFLSFG